MKETIDSHVKLALLCEQLLAGASVHDLVEETGLHTVTARRIVKTLRDKGLLVKIRHDPDPTGRPSRTVYRFRRSPKEQDVERELKLNTLARYDRKERLALMQKA